jgi:hypothetical protein
MELGHRRADEDHNPSGDDGSGKQQGYDRNGTASFGSRAAIEPSYEEERN